MIQFHRNKFTGPLDLLQKKKKEKDFRLHGCPAVSWWTFFILLKNGLYMATDTKGLGSLTFKNLLLPV